VTASPHTGAPTSTSAPVAPAAIHRAVASEVAAHLDVDPAVGLDPDEVVRRRETHGPNRLAEPERRPAWRRYADQFRSPIVVVLGAAAVLAGLVGDLKDAVVIAGVLVLNGILGAVQEGRAENALSALEGMLALDVRVRRGGRVREVPGDELVPGDVVLLESGDRVPADGRILTASALAVEEATLTGESVPVDKRSDPLDLDDPDLGDRVNEMFMNTVVVRGRAELLVTATGMGTEVGRIAELLSAEVESSTPLEQQLHDLGLRLAKIVGVAVLVVLGVLLLRDVPLGEALLEAVALGVAAIPEGLPAVVTVTLAVGVSQMAKRNAIVRRLASVETLGSTSVICTDKTGTLTRNEMAPVHVWHAGELHEVEDGRLAGDGDSLHRALSVAVLASDAERGDADDAAVGDPTELALLLAARAGGAEPADVRAGVTRTAELPFDSGLKLMGTVTTDPDGGRLLAVKGATDVLLDRCTSLSGPDGTRPLDDETRERITAHLERDGQDGLRVLAVASRRLDGSVPETPDEVRDAIEDLTLEAMVAMVDPPRDGVADAIALCSTAGVAVKMITGDHPRTAGAIARRVGIEGEVVTGRDLDAMDDDELAARIGDIGVCARVSPEHKVRIVDALRAGGHVVAMTGDGVNDAAALRRAHVGVAMGIAGTDVTREAADVVLADDDFSTIVAAVEKGRSIYDNIVTFVRFQLTTNIAAILTILTAGIIGLPSPFTALQILFVNLIADGPPAMALGVDRARPDVMSRQPRTPGRTILDRAMLTAIVPTAVVMAVATLVVVATTGEETRGTMAFTTFVLLQLGNVVAVRGSRAGVLTRHLWTNRWVWSAIAMVLLVQVGVVHWAPLQSLFDTTALDAGQWLVAVAVGLLPIVLTEAQTRLGLGRSPLVGSDSQGR
jgi:P-type Ca2+ transporter type 2C